MKTPKLARHQIFENSWVSTPTSHFIFLLFYFSYFKVSPRFRRRQNCFFPPLTLVLLFYFSYCSTLFVVRSVRIQIIQRRKQIVAFSKVAQSWRSGMTMGLHLYTFCGSPKICCIFVGVKARKNPFENLRCTRLWKSPRLRASHQWTPTLSRSIVSNH